MTKTSNSTFTVKDLKGLIENLPEEMPVALIDSTTDDELESTYQINQNNFEVLAIESYPEGEPKGNALFIVFKNKRIPEEVV